MAELPFVKSLLERVFTRSSYPLKTFILFFLFAGCSGPWNRNDDDTKPVSVKQSLYSQSYRIGPFQIRSSFSFKSFSNESADLFGYASDSLVEIFEMNTGKKLLSHNLRDVFHDSIGQINSFVIDSLSYVIVTEDKLFIYNGNFSVVKLKNWVESGLVIGNLSSPAFSSKTSKLCFSLIDYRFVDSREHLYDYNHIGVLDLITGEIDVLDVPYSSSMKVYGDYIVPYTFVTYHDGFFVVSSNIDDKVYLVNHENLSVSSYTLKSDNGSVKQLSVERNREIAKAKNQEFGFNYLKAWVSLEDSAIYRLVKLQRDAKLSNGTFSTDQDQPYSLIKYSLKFSEKTEVALPKMKAGQEMEMFLHHNEICYRTNYVLSRKDTTWNFIFNCYSIR
jgi:hypothetical protein